MPKQKIAVRDKFYTLAKEQGYRARSAFKLLQLNRKYGLLDDCSRAIDLCAAPGGWLQVLAKAMPPRPERQIIGVDLLPIKPLRGCVTFQADITTAECRRLIRHELKGNQADVVLCDGAPNVGSAFNKDAFVQSELALAALRFATDHLRRGGSFVTKVFRSADYNALIWCFQQLFRKVEATKPTSSRNVSAEIFVVCREYIAPDKIDPKLLDPKYVFAQVTPDDAKESKMPLSLLLGEDKKNTQRKFRAGYEDNAGALISKKIKAADFIRSEDPVRVLTEATELVLATSSSDEDVDETDAFIASHPATTAEVKLLCADIKVLGKGDFKQLIKWRMAVLKDLKKLEKASPATTESKGTEDEEEEEKDDEEEEDDEIELGKALLSLEERRKKEEKRIRKQQAKLQRHKDQGLIHPFAYDLADQDVPFSIKSLGLTSTKDTRLDGFREGERVNRPVQQDDDDDDESEPEESYSDLIEKQLEADYERYSRRKELNEPMTVQERRRQLAAEKKAKKKKSALERMTEEDFQRALEEAKLDAYNKGVYAKMLRKGTLSKEEREDGSSSSSDDDDEEDDQNESLNEQQDGEEEEGEDDEDKQKLIEKAKAKRWFEQQVFHDPVLMEDEEDDDEEDSIDPESIPLPRDLLDKEKRKLKRKKEEARKERKRLRKEQKEQATLGVDDELPVRKTKKDVEIVPASSNGKKRNDLEGEEEANDYDFDEDDAREQLKNKRELDPKIKSLIEKGMGKLKSDASSSKNNNNKIEVVKNNTNKNKKSKLDSDDEAEDDSDTENLIEAYNSDDYDSDERAEHLALGALLAKRSTRTAVLDAAYNRYAFNDDSLPAWFAEDESRHNRPNLPITKEMVESVKARFSDMNDRPIKKVAEARMRKKKRAIKKLEEAKRKAAAVVDEPDLSGRSKIRTIEKLFKGATVKRPGSVYVVSQKGGTKKAAGGGKGGKGAKVKVVDPRMKKDMRAQKRKDGKGKGGGGGKRRKQH